MQKISSLHQERMIALRKFGKSIPEISKETGIPKTTVQRYMKGVEVPSEFQAILREKQGGSKDRAIGLRANIDDEVKRFTGEMSERDHFFLLIGLYWGEGTKGDFSLMNSDPALIRMFVRGVYNLGVTRERISIAIRIHEGISILSAKKYWTQVVGCLKDNVGYVEVIKEGRKKGKLPYGMCRVRVKAGIRERLWIQSTISFIGKIPPKR